MMLRNRSAGLWVILCLAVCGSRLLADEAPSVAPVSAARMTSIVKAVERATRSCVNIHSEKRAKTADVLFSAGKDKKISGMGTGIVVDERGYIVTNYHVVRDVESLRVTLHDGSAFNASVVSYDSREDLAIIKIESAQPLSVMPFGTSSDLMLAEDVLAIGNAFGYEHTVTRGIISHLHRDVEVDDEQSYRNLIQIDAAINPGNSGGPLLNGDGDVIGINVAIRAGAQRIGFAIPIDDARVVISRLLSIEALDKTYHGLELSDVKHGADRKLLVRRAFDGSPGQSAGLQPGDVIRKAGNSLVIDAADLERILLGRHPGDVVDLQIERAGANENLQLKLAALSPERATPAHRTLPNIAPTPTTTPAPTTTTTTAAATDALSDRIWNVFGLRLSKVAAGDTSLAGQPYHGGLSVTAVRPDSPAARNGLQNGDVLVGLHVWETISPENLTYILNHPQFSNFNPLKFYILRNRETLYGHFDLTTTASHAQSGG
ncbi:MAG: trypsin-like peptidase domain-containing protein [Planctomycetaceae bacterium]